MSGTFRFSFGPWNIHEGADPFGPTVRPTVAWTDKLPLYKKLGFDGVQFHDDDAVPDVDTLSAAQVEKTALEMRQLLDGEGNILVTQQTGPASVDYPVTDWKVGETVRGQYDIFIPSDAPKGSYHLKGQLVRLPGGKVFRSSWVSQQFVVQ